MHFCFFLTSFFFFFFNDTATTEIYTLSLHDALPICLPVATRRANGAQPRSPHAAQSGRQQPAGGRRVVPHAGVTRLRAPVFHVRSSSHPQIAFALSIFSTQIDGQVNSPAPSCF